MCEWYPYWPCVDTKSKLVSCFCNDIIVMLFRNVEPDILCHVLTTSEWVMSCLILVCFPQFIQSSSIVWPKKLHIIKMTLSGIWITSRGWPHRFRSHSTLYVLWDTMVWAYPLDMKQSTRSSCYCNNMNLFEEKHLDIHVPPKRGVTHYLWGETLIYMPNKYHHDIAKGMRAQAFIYGWTDASLIAISPNLVRWGIKLYPLTL